jgi:hypothetical protein
VVNDMIRQAFSVSVSLGVVSPTELDLLSNEMPFIPMIPGVGKAL